jgi:hypothetical protein
VVQEALAEPMDAGLVRCSAHPFGVEVHVVAG